MPLPRTWRHITRLARLSELQARCLQLRCVGWEHADEIAEILDLGAHVVIGALLTGQGRCRASRPWLRRPYDWEQERARKRHAETAAALLAAGREVTEFRPYDVIDLDDDLLADAREILLVERNEGMSHRPPAARGGGVLQDASKASPERLVRYWLDCLTGSAAVVAERQPAAFVLEKLRSRRGKS